MSTHSDVFTRFKERQRGSAPFDPSQGPSFIIQPSNIYLEQKRQRAPGSSPLSRKRKEFDDSMFDTPPEGLRIPLSDHDNNLPRKRLSIQSNSSYQSIKSKTGTHHITTASVQTPSARHEKISSPRISSPTPHHTVHKDTETSKTDTHSTLPLGLPQSTFKQSQVEPQENEPGGLQYNQRESTPPKTVDEVASQQDSPLPGRQSSPISAYPNVSFDDDFGAYDIDDVLDAAEVDPVIDKVGNESLLQQQDRSNDVHSPSIESLDPKAQQAQEREVAIQKVRAGFSKALSNDNPESLNPNYFSRQLGDIDELIRTISRNTSGGTANFDPAVVQSTEELESNIMEQMNALRKNRQRYCELELYLRTMELIRGMRRKESVDLLKKRNDLKAREAAAQKDYQELKQKWKAIQPLGTLIEAMRQISSGE